MTFVDVADRAANVETVAGYLREVPLDVVARADWILARWGPENQGWPPASESADAVQERLRDIGSNARSGVVPFEIGVKPDIVWSSLASGSQDHNRVLLARARASEVDAFLRWGHGLWLPDGYHYVLPSGKHTGSFVRLSDAFQDIRAAAALSTWLYESLNEVAPTTLVMDIGTLMPLVSELQMAAERHRAANTESSARVGAVLALDRYPSNSLGVQRNLLGTSPDSPILGLVSVSDSGGFAERLLNAFSAFGAPTVRIEQLISRRLPSATAIPEEPTPIRSIEDPWLCLNVPQETGPDNDTCALCRVPSRARLVRINPRAMSAMVLPEPDLVVPDIFDARTNSTIWEVYRTTNTGTASIRLVTPAEEHQVSQSDRPVEEPVRFEPDQLVRDAPSDLIGKRLEEFDSLPKRNRKDNVRTRIRATRDVVADQASIVVFEQKERDRLSDDRWGGLGEALRAHQFVTEQAQWIGYTTVGGLHPTTDVSDRGAPGVLILALDSRVGLSYQRMFLAGRQQWPGGSFRGLVLHAHPEDERVWTSMRNTFRDSNGTSRLLALWLTYLPNWSPLAVERDTYLAAQQHGLNSREMEERLEEIRRVPPAGRTLLGRSDPELRPHSYFGQGLGSREALCAVGSAMQTARIRARPRGSPYWTQFDLRRALRSYFDGLIHASILRWCEPQEAWWGPSSRDCCDFLLELERVDFDFDLLLPELLLACAQEKLPESAMAQLVQTAQTRVAGADDQRTHDHLALGIALCELALDGAVGAG